jgi:hypothetical protein
MPGPDITSMAEKGSYLRKTERGLRLGNRFLAVDVYTRKGLDPRCLRSPRTGLRYSDLPYSYVIHDKAERPTFEGYSSRRRRGQLEITLEGGIGSLRIRHRFAVPDSRPYVEEEIGLGNTGSGELATAPVTMGFTRRMRRRGELVGDGSLVAVPFRRALQGRVGEYQDFSFEEIIANAGPRRDRWPEDSKIPRMGSEGWIWSQEGTSLLVAKHSPEAIEFSILSVKGRKGDESLVFGGASTWHGDPEEAAVLEAGGEYTFAPTRYIPVNGGIKEGYYAFRDLMDSHGHGTPQGFNPPVHWNELYDNPLWWGEDTYRKRQELYDLAHMEEEAEKAREIGCEALYLDPGWDTSFGSSLWPPYRLMEAGEFVDLMRQKYGLGVSLHMPLAVWCDATQYPLEAHRRRKDGAMLDSLCSASPAYLRTKEERLLKLAEAGFVYYMFDGSAFPGECWDPAHGHSLPLRRSEHCRSILKLARAVHRRFPGIIIELHDPMLGGTAERYAPMHYLHGLRDSFDEGWAFEYMWDPMEDLVSGRAVSLYYYNLAYSLPLYIHIDLRKDNGNALEFWWYASTCRHMGIGGKHPRPEVWEAHKRAMKRYLELKQFFTQGIFRGIEEDVHLHLLPGRGVAVLNVFNLDSKGVVRDIRIPLEELAFTGVAGVTEGAWKLDGKELSIRLEMEGRDAKVVEIVST